MKIEQVKFRAWEKRFKQMIPVNDIKFDGDIGIINTQSAWRTFDEIELMQYTGRQDKKDVPIYQGDIVRVVVKWFCPPGCGGADYDEEEVYITRIIFKDFGWATDTIKNYITYEDIEVIGNIYENPELLTNVKKIVTV